MIVDPSRQELSEVEAKAVRLVAEGKVSVQWVERRGRAAHGIVEGDHDKYQTSFSPAGRICVCPAGANHQTCSHALALELKVADGDYLQLELL
jgi:hypothetical protein